MNKYKKILKKVGVVGLMVVAFAAVWMMMPAGGAEAANILSVIIIDLAVVLIALDKASGFAILNVQSKLLTPPALTLL